MEESVAAMQRDIQRKLGRCLLLVQLYERLIKRLAAQHKLSGTANQLVSEQAKRAEFFLSKTLGRLLAS